jgi:threonine aldolase
MKNSFASDNVSGVCPEIMDAIVAANDGIASSYGADDHSARLTAVFAEFFERPVQVFPVVSGTAANALALAAVTPSYGKVFCHEMSHINTDECGAPEFFTGGAKLIPIASADGKITPDALVDRIRGAGNVHSAQPATLSLTQSAEVGAVYAVNEVAALAEVAHAHGIRVHMDGARFSNACVALGVSPAELTWCAGIDVLSFGGTKNGCMAAEAVVFFDDSLSTSFPFVHKRAGHLLSKTRYVSAQLEAFVQTGTWHRNALHANAMAKRLSDGLAAIETIQLAYPTESNEVFAHIPRAVISGLAALDYVVTEGELDETAPPRFVTAWNTEGCDVDAFLAAVKQVVAAA